MLAAMLPSPYKAAASFGASPTQRNFAINSDMSKHFPFDVHNHREVILRSPVDFTASIRIPIYSYVGEKEEWLADQHRVMQKRAGVNKKPFHFFTSPGDHFSHVEAALRDSSQRFKRLASRGKP